jgi:hypothetical protein
MRTRVNASLYATVGRLKQLFRYWTAGDLFAESERIVWLRDGDHAGLLARLESIARGDGTLRE